MFTFTYAHSVNTQACEHTHIHTHICTHTHTHIYTGCLLCVCVYTRAAFFNTNEIIFVHMYHYFVNNTYKDAYEYTLSTCESMYTHTYTHSDIRNPQTCTHTHTRTHTHTHTKILSLTCSRQGSKSSLISQHHSFNSYASTQ